MSKHTPGPWQSSGVRVRDNGETFLQVSAPVVGVIAYVAYSDKTPENFIQSRADQRLVAASPEMYDALLQWKCPACGGKGTYQQNAIGRARAVARGRVPDPAFNPDPVTCKVCDGSGRHPIAHAVLVKASL